MQTAISELLTSKNHGRNLLGSEVGLLSMNLDLDVWLSILAHDLEGEVLHVGLDLSILESTADEALRVEDGVVGVHRDLVLRGIADQPLAVGERDIRGCRAVTLVVGNDLDTIILPDTDTPAKIASVDAPDARCKEITHE